MRVFLGLLAAISVSGLGGCVDAPQTAGRVLFENNVRFATGQRGAEMGHMRINCNFLQRIWRFLRPTITVCFLPVM